MYNTKAISTFIGKRIADFMNAGLSIGVGYVYFVLLKNVNPLIKWILIAAYFRILVNVTRSFTEILDAYNKHN